MSQRHHDLIDWIEQGRMQAADLPAALQLAGVTPDAGRWRHFLDRLALWLGVIFCGAALIFFLAYNWQAMGRYAKFALAEALIVAALAASWQLGQERVAGKAALLAATLFTGALLALVGQTYQTGADTYELFGVWALAIFVWVAAGRFGALWLFWLGLLNFSVALYFKAFPGLLGVLFSTEKLLWMLFALNTLALCLWEFAAHKGIAWLQERWPVRLLTIASGGMITVLALWAVLDFKGQRGAALLGYGVWMALAYAVYRHWQRDVFVLAGGVLSLIIVVTATLSKQLLRNDHGGGFLLIGMLVIGLSALGGYWLKSVAREEHAA